MRKTKSRILATFLSFCMILTLLPTMAFAEDAGGQGDSMTVTLEDGQTSDEAGTDTTIAPEVVESAPVEPAVDEVIEEPVLNEPTTPEVVDSVKKETAPDTEETAPDTEETAPDTEKTAPDTEETAPDTEKTAPDTEETAPDTEETAPDTEETAPDTEETVPATEETVPATEEAVTPAMLTVLEGGEIEVLSTSSVTATASYNTVTELETVTATDEKTITVVINATTAQQSSGSTISITIPRGVDLAGAPGVSSVSNGVVTVSDANLFTGATGTPTWVGLDNITDSNSNSVIPSASGTLTYNLTNASSVSFEITMNVNSRFVPVSENGSATISMGDVTVTLCQTNQENASDTVEINATTQDDNLHFGELTVREYASNSLDQLGINVIKTNLMEDNVNTVKLSTSVLINSPFAGVNAMQTAVDITFDLTVPEGATAVANGYYSVVKVGESNVYTVNPNGTNISVSSGVSNMSDFVIVTLPEDEIVKDAEFTFKIDNLKFEHRNYYDATSDTFTRKIFTNTVDTKTADIGVIGYVDTYNQLYISGGGNKTQTNNYYETGDTIAEYWAKVQANSDTLQAQILMTLRREFTEVTDATTTDSNISLLPVQMSFVANKVEYETDKEAYLDVVNYVNFDVPFIGEGAPRQSSELLSLTITTEEYDVSSTSKYAEDPYQTTTKKSYTFDATGFMNKITGTETQIGNYNFGESNPIDIACSSTGGYTGNVEYHWAFERTPMFKISAPAGESITGVIAEFSGDTDSFYYADAGYDYKMIGYPKKPDGVRSSYTYTIIQDTDSDGDYEEEDAIDTATAGFMWEEPDDFLLTVANTSATSLTYLFNTAEANVIGTSGRAYSLTGYHNLGSVSVVNNTKAMPKTGAEIVATAEIDTTGDIVEQIYFPYIATRSEVEEISYTLDDGSTTGAEISYESTYGIITAPEGKSFTAFSVTLEGWTNLDTESVFELRGYLKVSDELLTGDVVDAHKLTVTPIVETTFDGSVDTTFKIADTTYANMRAVGTTELNAFGDTGLEECNVLSPGSTTDIEFKLFGGQYENRDNSSWHDIVFTVVLPKSIELNGISVGDFNLEHLTEEGAAYQYVDTGEGITGIEYIEKEYVPVKLTEEEAKGYFTEATGTVKGATIYKYKVSDEDVNLYWARYGGGNHDTFANFTVTMNVTIDIQAADVAVPWSEVLIMGTSCAKVENFNAAVGKKDENAFDGVQIKADTLDSKMTTGVTDDVVVGGNDVYLFIDGDPVVSVQDAYIEKSDGTTYPYHKDTTKDEDVAIFLTGETGTLHFSVIDTVSDAFDGDTVIGNTNYVLFPLPTGTATNALQTDAEFGVTVNDVTITPRTGTYTKEPKYSAEYVNLTEAEIENLKSASLKTLYESGSAEVAGANAILLAITSQEQFSTIDVAIDFTAPTSSADDEVYVELSGMTSYYSDTAAQSLYYGGVAPSGADSANSYVRFAYYHPGLAVSYAGVCFQGTTATTGVPTGSILPTPPAVNYNSRISIPADPSAATGYTFVGWYEDADCTDSFTGTTIKESITIYAKYTENEYTVTYKNADGTENSTDKMYWTDTFTLPTAPTVAGSVFDGWYYGTTKITDTTVYKAIDTAGSGGLDITATYIGNSYTVTYNDGDAATADTTQTYTWSQAFALITAPTKTGYELSGWSLTSGGAVVDFENVDTYGEAHDLLHLSTDTSKEVTLYAIWTVKSYDVQFKVGDTVDDDDTVELDWTDEFTAADFPTAPTVAGSVFDGWYYGSTKIAAGTKLADILLDDTVSVVEITAVFTAKTGYKIDYHYEDGGNDVDLSVNVTGWNTVVTLPINPSLEGYGFGGWFDAASEGNEVTIGATTTYGDLVANDEVKTLHLYAQWKANEYTITFNLGEHSNDVIASITAVWDENITIPSTVSESDEYKFANWLYGTVSVMSGTHSFEEEFGDILTDEDKVDKTIELDAKYTVENHQIEFYDETTEMSDLHEAYDANEDLVLPDYTKDGYTFDGWYTLDDDKVETGEKFSAAFPDEKNNSTVNLYAKFTANEYTVVYDLDGGAVADGTTSQTYAWSGVDEDVDFITEPTKAGYTFSCWSKTEDGENPITEGSSYETTFGDTFGALTETYKYSGTVYAMWTAKEYTVSYSLGYTEEGVPENDTYAWEDTISLPTAEEVARSGYTFNGWYLEDTFTTKVVDGVYGTVVGVDDATTPVVLYAKYTKNYSGSTGGGGGGGSSTSSSISKEEAEVVEEVTIPTTDLDTTNHFAYMFGYEDGTFGVDKNITRAEAIVMFARLMVDKMDATQTYPSTFVDVTPNLWYANTIGYMEQFGIVSGYDDGTFGGGKYITRAEFTAIASRFSSLISTDENAFYDVKDTHWALRYINSAAAKGWIGGYEDSSFKPEQPITRAEAVCVVNNVLGRDCDKDYVLENSTEIAKFSDLATSHWAYYNVMEATNSHDYTKSEGKETWISLD